MRSEGRRDREFYHAPLLVYPIGTTMARRDAPATRFRSNGARARPAARDTSPPLISLVVFVQGHILVDPTEVAEGDPDREGLPEFLFISV